MVRTKNISCVELSDDKHTNHIHERRILPYSERRIDSLEALTSLMQGMDLDEGIRIVGQVEGFKGGGFIFVAKSGSRYCINICDRILDPAKKTYFVGGNDEWWYFDTFEKAWQKLKPLLSNPMEAYSY
jgi:hypothetical protein